MEADLKRFPMCQDPITIEDDSDLEDGPGDLQRAHLAWLAAEQARRRRAQQQMADLLQYQREEQAKRNIQRRNGFAQQIRDGAAAFRSAAPDGGGGSSAAEGWHSYEARWSTFEANPPERITCDSIPWPPSAAQLLDWLATAVLEPTQAARSGGDISASARHTTEGSGGGFAGPHVAAAEAAAKTRRAAFRQASMRWHPDKFEARHGGRIPVDAKQAVLAAVQALMQGILEAAATEEAAF